MNSETLNNDWTANNLPYLQPFSGTKEEFDDLRNLAAQDEHTVFYPTEVVWKGGEKVGWFSVGAMPTVWSWMSTRKMKIRDSVQSLGTVEGIIRRSGAPGLYLPCSKDSPFYPYLEKLGYLNGGPFDFFYKPFNRRDIIR